MEAGQNLFLNNMMSKLKKAKEDLEKNNETLEEAKDKIRAFTNDNTFQGEAANTAKTQMETYILVANAMIQANDCDIADYYTLNHMLWEAQQSVGGDDLIGEVIVEQMNKAERMAEQDRERAVEIDRMQTKSHNPFADAWYQMKEIYYKKSAEDNEELYKEWKKRADKYDEIENNTSSLFENGEELRQQAENALRELGKNFNGEGFNVYDDDWWKIGLINSMKEKGYVGLGDDLSIFYWKRVFNEETGKWEVEYAVAFGGDQNWFKPENIKALLDNEDLTDEERKYFEDEKLNKALVEGCPVIAIINMKYAMEGKKYVTQKEFMLDVYKYLDDHPGYKKISKLIGKAGTPDEDLFPVPNVEDYVEDYMRENGHCSDVEMNNINGGSLRYIEKQVKAKRPVVMTTETITGLEWYKEVEDEKDKNKHQLKKQSFQKEDKHVATITGVKTMPDPETQELKKYVEVSSWGEKYFIPYENLEKNKNKVKIADYR